MSRKFIFCLLKRIFNSFLFDIKYNFIMLKKAFKNITLNPNFNKTTTRSYTETFK